MIKKVIIFSSIGLVFVFIFLNWDSETLGDNYYYFPDLDGLDTGLNYGPIIYKSTNKNSFENIIIKSNVIDFRHNFNFIIVKQKPRYDNSKINYFIIFKKNDICLGPFNKEKFEENLLKYKINLKFN